VAPLGARARAGVGPALVVLVGFGVFLSIYVVRGIEGAIGWDATQYAWRGELAAAVGLDALPDRLPSGIEVKAGRPGFPAVAGPAGALLGASMLDMTAILPVALALAVGLAGAAVAVPLVGDERWGFAALGVVAVVSPNVVLMLRYAYLDNLLVTAIFLAAAAVAVLAVRDRRRLIPAVALHAAAGLAHPPFVWVTSAILVAAAAVLLRRSGRERAEGRGRLDTSAARLLVVGVGGAVASLVLRLALAVGTASPVLERSGFVERLGNDLGAYLLPVTIPLAVAGAVLALHRLRGPSPASPPTLALLLGWSGMTIAAVGAFVLLPLPIPANRVLVFALAIPLLAAVGVILLAGGLRGWLRPAAVVMVVSALALVGTWRWINTAPQTDPARLREAAWLAAYLEAARIPPDREVVVIVDDRSEDPATRTMLMVDHLLAALPPGRMGQIHPYLGSTASFLAGEPSEGPGAYRRASRRFLERIDPASAVAVVLPSYRREPGRGPADPRPGEVVQGPARPPGLDVEDPVIGTPRLAVLALATLLLLGLAGGGWARRLVGGDDAVRAVALAPAIGAAGILLVTLAADRFGLGIASPGAAAIPVLVGAAGWVAAARKRRPA